MKSIINKVLLASALVMPLSANAVPIQGDIGIGGALLPTCDAGGACSMADATGLDFLGDMGFVLSANGDFETAGGLTAGSSVAMTDFTFDPFAGVDPLWSAGGFSFSLDSLTVVGQTDMFIELRGTGVISFSGPTLDPTMGNWSFSADIATGASTFAWSSTTAPGPTAAPEPGILVLMGLGLIGGLGARRLTRRA